MVNLSRWEGQYNNDDRIVRNSLPGFMSIPMFARFIVDDIKIKFWPSEYHNITEEFESAGQETGVDIGFTTPTDFSPLGWGGRDFRICSTTVNYFNEESALGQESIPISSLVGIPEETQAPVIS